MMPIAGPLDQLSQTAVVTGGTGIVGSGIVRALLASGVTVVAPVRSERRKADLLEDLEGVPVERLEMPVCDYGTQQGADQLAAFVRFEHETVDHVVACVGGMVAMGRLSEVKPEAFQSAMQDRVLAQVLLAQALAPLLKEEPTSSYTVITGRLGEVCTMPDGALFCVANAAVYGVTLALQGEYRDKPQRINELRIGGIVRKDSLAEHPSFPGQRSYPASRVAAEVLSIAQGQLRGQVVRLNLDQE